MAEIVVRPMEVKGQSQEPVRVFCENGANLLQALLDAGIFVDNACSGKGICGKCKRDLCLRRLRQKRRC